MDIPDIILQYTFKTPTELQDMVIDDFLEQQVLYKQEIESATGRPNPPFLIAPDPQRRLIASLPPRQ